MSCERLVSAACLAALALAVVVAAARDHESRIIPNGCPIAALTAGVLRATVRGELSEAVLGVVAVLLVMLPTSLAWLALRGERGVGGGDVKLLAAVGSWVGPAWGLVVVGASCLVGVLGWVLAEAARRICGQPGEPTGGIPLAIAIAPVSLCVVLLSNQLPV